MTKLREIYLTEPDLTLAGGKNGLDNIVELTHMAENIEICRDFVKENELVFTTGSGLRDDSQLFKFVRTAYKNGACGIVINFGPYFPTLSDDIVSFANDNAFPVFTCTWEVRMPDIMYRISCLIEGEKTSVGKKSIALKTAALHPERADILRSAGYSQSAKFTIALTRKASEIGIDVASFDADGFTCRVFVNTKRNEILPLLKNTGSYVGAECDINSFAKSFTITEKFARVFYNNDDVMFIEDSGIYFLLLSLNDDDILSRYANSILGQIEKKDKNNKNDLVNTLKTYLDCNKSLSAAARILGVHKNTVNNKIKKIEDISNIDISDPIDELNLRCAFISREIIQKI